MLLYAAPLKKFTFHAKRKGSELVYNIRKDITKLRIKKLSQKGILIEDPLPF